MNEWLWLALAFFSGSVPYSLLLGKLLLKRDIRRFGDGNPGATNLIRAGGDGGWIGNPLGRVESRHTGRLGILV